MCRSDVDDDVHVPLARLLDDMAAALRQLSGLPPSTPVVIGPVDFGEPSR